MVRIASLNVNGLADKNKRVAVFNHYRTRCDILCLQETHSTAESEEIWTNEWRGRTIWSHGDSNARGTAILFNNTFTGDISQILKDNEGRLTACNVFFNNTYFSVICVYGPNSSMSML